MKVLNVLDVCYLRIDGEPISRKHLIKIERIAIAYFDDKPPVTVCYGKTLLTNELMMFAATDLEVLPSAFPYSQAVNFEAFERIAEVDKC